MKKFWKVFRWVLLAILVLAVYGAILYGITVRMLHRHLNLD